MTAAVLLAGCQESIEEKFEREARTFTKKQCPVQINPGTRMDSMTFDRATHTQHYYYTLTGIADSEEKLKSFDVKEVLKAELKNATNVREQKDAGCNFEYTYRSASKGTVLAHVILTPEDYR